MNPAYDISQSYTFNYQRGPKLSGSEEAEVGGELKEFLGLKVRSRIGIAAGLLLNSRWIEGYSKLGFDLLTYKTVRSKKRPCYDPPNWFFVEEDLEEGVARVIDPEGRDPTGLSSAVCFGMPSMAPEVWREDVRRSKALMKPGQLLIVSVVATPGEHSTQDAVAEDFRVCAEWAVEAGADVIEANFSCPNVCSAEGTIYQDPGFSGKVAQGIRGGIGDVPLLIKCGHVAERDALTRLMVSLAGSADGVTLVNGMVMPVIHADGTPAFGPEFRSAGVLGRGIHEPSLLNVRSAVEVVQSEGLDLTVAAVGGVSTVTDAEDFFAAGAEAVLMGSSPMFLPGLAGEIKGVHPDW